MLTVKKQSLYGLIDQKYLELGNKIVKHTAQSRKTQTHQYNQTHNFNIIYNTHIEVPPYVPF